MKTRKAVITVAIAAAAIGVSAAPALAATHAPFIVQDNGSTLVTSQHLTVGQEIYSSGIAYHVSSSGGANGAHSIKLWPQLPTSDNGRAVPFTW